MTNIVFLDRSALHSDVSLENLAQQYTLVKHQNTASNQILERLDNAKIAILSKIIISEEHLRQLPKLKHIAVCASGYNVVDIQACKKYGISVSNVPNYAATTVSEHVITCALSLRRKLIEYRQHVIDGAWQKSSSFCLFAAPIFDLNTATLGIIGMGDIGQATAKLARALGMKVIFCARQPQKSNIAEQASFEQLLNQSDVISVHCSLNESTHNLIGTKEFKQMKQSAILINTARGGIVNELDLVAAIDNKQIAATAVDVLEREPPTDQASLLTIANNSNVIITPHCSWTSQQAMQNLTDSLTQNIRSFLHGQPRNIISN